MSLLLLLLLGGGTRAQSEDEHCFGCGGGLQKQNIRVELTLVREEYNIGWVNITFHRQMIGFDPMVEVR